MTVTRGGDRVVKYRKFVPGTYFIPLSYAPSIGYVFRGFVRSGGARKRRASEDKQRTMMARGERALIVAAVMTYVSGTVAFSPSSLLWRGGRAHVLHAGRGTATCGVRMPFAATRRIAACGAAAPAAGLTMLIENSLVEEVDSGVAQAALASEDGVPLIIAFCASRCGPCKVLEPQVLSLSLCLSASLPLCLPPAPRLLRARARALSLFPLVLYPPQNKLLRGEERRLSRLS